MAGLSLDAQTPKPKRNASVVPPSASSSPNHSLVEEIKATPGRSRQEQGTRENDFKHVCGKQEAFVLHFIEQNDQSSSQKKLAWVQARLLKSHERALAFDLEKECKEFLTANPGLETEVSKAKSRLEADLEFKADLEILLNSYCVACELEKAIPSKIANVPPRKHVNSPDFPFPTAFKNMGRKKNDEAPWRSHWGEEFVDARNKELDSYYQEFKTKDFTKRAEINLAVLFRDVFKCVSNIVSTMTAKVASESKVVPLSPMQFETVLEERPWGFKRDGSEVDIVILAPNEMPVLYVEVKIDSKDNSDIVLALVWALRHRANSGRYACSLAVMGPLVQMFVINEEDKCQCAPIWDLREEAAFLAFVDFLYKHLVRCRYRQEKARKTSIKSWFLDPNRFNRVIDGPKSIQETIRDMRNERPNHQPAASAASPNNKRAA